MGTGGKTLKGKRVLANIIEFLERAMQVYDFECGGSNGGNGKVFFKNTQTSGVYTFTFGPENRRYKMTIEEDNTNV